MMAVSPRSSCVARRRRRPELMAIPKCRPGTVATSAPIPERAIDFDLPNHGISIDRVELFNDDRHGRFEPAMRRGPHSGALGRVDHLEFGPLRPSGAFFLFAENPIESRWAPPWIMALGDEDNPAATIHRLSDGHNSPSFTPYSHRWRSYFVQPVSLLDFPGALPGLSLVCGRAGGDGDPVATTTGLNKPLLLLGHVLLGRAHYSFHLVNVPGTGFFEFNGSSGKCVPFCELSANIPLSQAVGLVGRIVQRVPDGIGKGVLPEFVQVIFELFNRSHIQYNFEQKLHLHVDLNTGKH